MDPLSIPATSIALASTVTRLSITVTKSVRETRDLLHDLEMVKHEPDSLASVLTMLGEDVEISYKASNPIPNSVDKILARCEDTVLEIEVFLSKFQSWGCIVELSGYFSGKTTWTS
ncbi:hypothetical protein B0O99DRAFT_679607 [Bisporella sp. PMI_857]|nr:hypothetical protein B0O99DRAFT_679607 [Bisporella sp. PMI_857]